MQSKQSELCQEYNKKTIQNCKETKQFLPLSFDRFIFTCSDIITLYKLIAELEFYTPFNFNVRVVTFQTASDIIS